MSEREKFEAWFKTTKHWKTLHEYIAIHETQKRVKVNLEDL